MVSRLLAMHTKIDGLSADMATNFRWTVGILLTGFAAMIAALVTQ